MTGTVVIEEEAAPDTGYRFSWSLAIAGGVAATAVTFFLLSLGAGFGLMLVHPITHSGPSMPAFLTGGAIYFFVAQAFGFAVGGHLAGRLLGPVPESAGQEEFRAGAHGFVAWAVAVLATLTVVAVIGLSAAGTGASTAALYGASAPSDDTKRAGPSSPSAYLVDVLFRPGANSAASNSSPSHAAAFDPADTVQAIPIAQQTTVPQNPPASDAPVGASGPASNGPATDDESGAPQASSPPAQTIAPAPYSDVQATPQTAPADQSAAQNPVGTIALANPDPRGEARRILDANLLRGEQMIPADHDRLVTIVAGQAGISNAQAAARVDTMIADIQSQARRAADIARKAASYASLWIAISLLFGAIVSVFAAVSARIEDDRQAVGILR